MSTKCIIIVTFTFRFDRYLLNHLSKVAEPTFRVQCICVINTGAKWDVLLCCLSFCLYKEVDFFFQSTISGLSNISTANIFDGNYKCFKNLQAYSSRTFWNSVCLAQQLCDNFTEKQRTI